MRKGLQKRTKEMQRAARALQDLGWVVTQFVLSVEDDGDRGMVPVGSLSFRYDPEKPTDMI